METNRKSQKMLINLIRKHVFYTMYLFMCVKGENVRWTKNHGNNSILRILLEFFFKLIFNLNTCQRFNFAEYCYRSLHLCMHESVNHSAIS